MELIHNKGAILKVVLMPTNGKTSIFQGFDSGICSGEFSEILFLTNKVPKRILDIFSDENNSINEDDLAFNPTILLSPEFCAPLIEFKDYPFVVIFCAPKSFSFAKGLSKDFIIPPIICCDAKQADIYPADVKTRYSFDKILYAKLKDLERIIARRTGEAKITTKLVRRSTSFKSVKLSSTLNNTTYPNEILIEGLGYMLEKPNKIKGGSSKREFVTLMIDSVNSYRDCLVENNLAQPDEVILYTPGMFSFIQDSESKLWEIIGSKLNEEEKEFLIKGVLRNPEYSGMKLFLNKDHKSIRDFIQNPKVGPLALLRRKEMRLTTAAISILSFNKKIPSLRLPNSINHLGRDLKKLEELASVNGVQSKQFIKKAKSFNTILRRTIGSKLRSEINDNFNKLSLVSDVPIDWLRLNDLPIMLTHELSRINSTPGNVLLQNCAYFPKASVNASDLKKVLIVRSFDISDKLKFNLEESLDVFKKNMPDLDSKIVDVKSKQELIDALNEYDGHIVVFDCHGNHGGDKENGWLHIGEERVDIWFIRGIARIPPIVILSACLTSPLSGSHASVANGFLVSGAICVIGTLLPVVSRESAIFVGRLIYRFYQFPNAIPEKFTHINLRLFISLFLRMSYVSDIIRGFVSSQLIDESESIERNIIINTHINMLRPDWFKFLLNNLCEMSGKDEREVLNIINEEYFITETMCYSQIGFPESLTINLRS